MFQCSKMMLDVVITTPRERLLTKELLAKQRKRLVEEELHATQFNHIFDHIRE